MMIYVLHNNKKDRMMMKGETCEMWSPTPSCLSVTCDLSSSQNQINTTTRQQQTLYRGKMPFVYFHLKNIHTTILF